MGAKRTGIALRVWGTAALSGDLLFFSSAYPLPAPPTRSAIPVRFAPTHSTAALSFSTHKGKYFSWLHAHYGKTCCQHREENYSGSCPVENPNSGYRYIDLYLCQSFVPAKLPGIVKQVNALPDIDPTDFIVDVDTGDADAVMKPLENMDRLVSILVLLVVMVGAAVLYLVLSGRIKERTSESGILLSLGLSRAP